MNRKTTREILAESFLELVERKSINKITITNITDNCHMSQPTFYNHFHDKYDLIVWIYVTRGAEIMGQIGADGYQWKDALVDGAKYFIRERDFVINAFKHTSGHDSFINHVAS